jgi:predicted AlkP superfamily phosphohydrolase/phosphomutase
VPVGLIVGSGARHEESEEVKRLVQMAGVGLLMAVALGLHGCGPKTPKVLVLGFDGMDPRLLRQYMDAGELPNLSKLARSGTFLPLATTNPPQSPVAWSTFITGLDPPQHGVFDFVHRDPKTLSPVPSLNAVEKGRSRLLRQGTPFWRYLEKAGVPARLVKLPASFPTVETSGTYLTDMGTPDLEGTYGNYNYYTDAPPRDTPTQAQAGGRRVQIEVRDKVVRASLIGPTHTENGHSQVETAPFQVEIDSQSGAALFEAGEQRALLKPGEWSGWLPITFPSGSGMVMLYLQSLSPHFSLYVSPTNIDPMHPIVPISMPARYASALAQDCGRFYTQGMPEETGALLDGLFSDDEFLAQNAIVVQERKRLFAHELAGFQQGFFFFYVSSSDILAHLYWNTIDPEHPGYRKERAEKYGKIILSAYKLADELVGEAVRAAGSDATVIVISDHGFAPFRRAVNLNLWLRRHGYQAGEPQAHLADLDWSRTTAYAVGFNSLYLNLKGRERNGIVEPGRRQALLKELSGQLMQLRDPKTGQTIIAKIAVLPQPADPALRLRSPDMLVGYKRGYRASWETALGEAGKAEVSDNLQAWSGDHLISPDLVPGVLLANRPPPDDAHPALHDLAPTILKLYGLSSPGELPGRPLW